MHIARLHHQIRIQAQSKRRHLLNFHGSKKFRTLVWSKFSTSKIVLLEAMSFESCRLLDVRRIGSTVVMVVGDS